MTQLTLSEARKVLFALSTHTTYVAQQPACLRLREEADDLEALSTNAVLPLYPLSAFLTAP